MHQAQHFHASIHHPVANDRAPPVRHGAQAGDEIVARVAAFGVFGEACGLGFDIAGIGEGSVRSGAQRNPVVEREQIAFGAGVTVTLYLTPKPASSLSRIRLQTAHSDGDTQ